MSIKTRSKRQFIVKITGYLKYPRIVLGSIDYPWIATNYSYNSLTDGVTLPTII
jgi:hypothetical protein